jgi:hypothetical protein
MTWSIVYEKREAEITDWSHFSAAGHDYCPEGDQHPMALPMKE